jgi:HlyD family secretion protein
MTSRSTSFLTRLKRLTSGMIVVAIVAGMVWGFRAWNRPAKPSLDGLTFVSARRADLKSILRAAGTTAAEMNTVIDCQLERLELRSEGRSSSMGGSSTILWVIDDGTYVKKGDLLCTLDASDYEELVRQQQIKVDRARADLDKAKLDFETSQMGVAEFRDGIMAQTIQEYEGTLKFAESDRERALDRLAWTERMKEKGYASLDQLATDKQNLKRCELAITKARWTLNLFNKFGGPLELKALQSIVESARAELISQQMRYERFTERFEHYKKMVGFCTIRAPHDGFVVYAKSKNPYFSSNAPIEAGSRVRQLQSLFYLPDLDRMKLITPLHESVLTRVQPGMTIRAKIEGLSYRELTGRVVKIDPLPDNGSNWLSDTKFFNATIHLDNPPRGIRPQMSAEVEIDLSSRPDVIAIPPEAMAIEDGADVCYVASSEGQLERRTIKLGKSTTELLEVVEGLDEGEQVVGDLAHIHDYDSLVVESHDHTGPADGHHASVPTVHPGHTKAGL